MCLTQFKYSSLFIKRSNQIELSMGWRRDTVHGNEERNEIDPERTCGAEWKNL